MSPFEKLQTFYGGVSMHLKTTKMKVVEFETSVYPDEMAHNELLS